jgi:hypothetical protein
MPLRMIDWRCPSCGHRWEELCSVTSDGQAVRPRCGRCRVLCERKFSAPAIRTADNAPRDMRRFTTAGHHTAGAQVSGNRVWDAQLGKATEHMTPREQERYAKQQGLEIVPAKVYGASHLSYEPPPPRLEDDPTLLRESEDDSADMFDRWQAGKLPQIETPMLDEARAEHDAAISSEVQSGLLNTVSEDSTDGR